MLGQRGQAHAGAVLTFPKAIDPVCGKRSDSCAFRIHSVTVLVPDFAPTRPPVFVLVVHPAVARQPQTGIRLFSVGVGSGNLFLFTKLGSGTSTSVFRKPGCG